MFTGILLISIIAFIGIISYRRPKLEKNVLKNVPLIDWMVILIFPLLMYVGIIIIVSQIITRTEVNFLDYDKLHILFFGNLFLIYGFVGNSIHFVSKVLSRYISPDKNNIVYRVNEIFHGKLSHYIVYICTIIVVFLIGILEINFPLPVRINDFQQLILVLSGMLFGISSAKAIFYTNEWFGGHNKPLFVAISVLTVVLLLLFRLHNLSFLYYPFNYFLIAMFSSIIMTFIIRQILIFTRLSQKKKLSFLSKLLSI